MKTNSIILFVVSFLVLACNGPEKKTEINTPAELNNSILSGWNTWDNRSIMTHVLLPEGLALQLRFYDIPFKDSLVYAFTGNRVKGTEQVHTLAHTPDGSYTDFIMKWKTLKVRVQSAVENSELYILVTPEENVFNFGQVDLICTMLFDKPGQISRGVNIHTAKLPGRNVDIFAVNASYFRQKLDHQAAYTTDPEADMDKVLQTVAAREGEYQSRVKIYAELAEVYNALQNAMNWLVVYDPQKNRAVTPVSRPWSYGWGGSKPGGYVLFCWDNFFAAYMHSVESRDLAFNEAIQMCYEIDDLGFVPNYSAQNNLKSRDRSQPPVGSMMILEIYKKYPEKWFLEFVFPRLLTWNRWWKDNRDLDGYLCWGSQPFEPVLNDRREMVQNEFSAASNESGLDNTPMYDGVPFDSTSHLLQIADVGLMGLYIGDCEALAEMADVLGRKAESDELRQRAKTYRNKLKSMWDEKSGMFLNKRMDTGELSKSISPTNFYALIGKAATQEQAERMVKEHFYNPDEFWGEWIIPSIARNDPGYTGMDYWRGSIWAPMNFLVYWGMRNYDLPKARRDLADKSRALLLKEWRQYGWVRENYHAETGANPEHRSELFYHWGALLGMINLLEYEMY